MKNVLFFTVPKILCNGGLLWLVGAFSAGVAGEMAEIAPLASRGLLLDIAQAGKRLVAVGERGHVLLSDDTGGRWRQAQSVPTQSLLTGVCFSDGRRGIAVGHDEVVLVTQDAGESWRRTHYAPQAQQPLLDVWCGEDGRAIAVGAYAIYFESPDYGATWMEKKFTAQPQDPNETLTDEDELAGDPHLNRIVAASPERFFIAAEAGHLYRSDDRGGTWRELQSPYRGSFFGVLPLGGETVLTYGLRGNLFRSDDGGAHWRKIETGTVAMLNDAVRLPNGPVVVAGLAGTVLVSRKEGRSFELIQHADRKGISAVSPAAPATLVAVGEGGVKQISLGPP